MARLRLIALLVVWAGCAASEHDAARKVSAEHAGEHPHLEPVSVAVATMLFTTLLLAIGLLCMINSRDKDIKASSYDMLNNTMSVFCAVLLNQGIFAVLVEQLICGSHPGLGQKDNQMLAAFMSFCVMLGFWIAMSYFGWSSRNTNFLQQMDVLDDATAQAEHIQFLRRARLYAISHLGGHCVAFGGIKAAGEVLHLAGTGVDAFGFYRRTAIILFIVTICVLFVCWRTMKVVRKKCVNPRKRDQGDKNFHHQYIARMEHGEIEGMVMIASFVVNQYLCIEILKAPLDLHAPQKDMTLQTVKWMFLVALISLALAVIVQMSIARSSHSHKTSHAIIFPFFSFSASWGFQWAFLWGTQLFFASLGSEQHGLAEVVNAFVVTVSCAIAIYIIDCIADRIEAPKTDNWNLNPLAHARVRLGSDVTLVDLHVDDAELARSFRTGMVSCGILVALSWDKAFHSAIQTIVAGTKVVMEKHKQDAHSVIFQCVTCFTMVLIVAPAWYWFIVPKVLIEDETHDHQHAEDDLQGLCEPSCCHHGGHDSSGASDTSGSDSGS